MGEMNQPLPANSPKSSRRKVILIGVGALLLVCVALGIVGALAGGNKTKTTPTSAATVVAQVSTTAPTVHPTATQAAKPTATIAPTKTPKPAPTAKPTQAAKPTPTPKPASATTYRTTIQNESVAVSAALDTIQQYGANPDAINNDPDTRLAFFTALGTIRGVYSEAQTLGVPAGYEAFNTQYLAGMKDEDTAAQLLSQAFNGGTSDEVNQAASDLTAGGGLIQQALAGLPAA